MNKHTGLSVLRRATHVSLWKLHYSVDAIYSQFERLGKVLKLRINELVYFSLQMKKTVQGGEKKNSPRAHN